MEEIIDLIALDSPALEVSDAIKQALFVKTSEKIENLRPEIAQSVFGSTETQP